jgi:hypothetical protein
MKYIDIERLLPFVILCVLLVFVIRPGTWEWAGIVGCVVIVAAQLPIFTKCIDFQLHGHAWRKWLFVNELTLLIIISLICIVRVVYSMK